MTHPLHPVEKALGKLYQQTNTGDKTKDQKDWKVRNLFIGIVLYRQRF